jgi:hypothetical protein
MGGNYDSAYLDLAIPPISTFAARLRDTVPQLPQSTKSSSTFYRNLDEVLDVRRVSGLYWAPVENQWQVGDAADFCSGGRTVQAVAEFVEKFSLIGYEGQKEVDGTKD